MARGVLEWFSHLMARVVEGLHRLWVFVRPVPHHKESGLHLIAAQDVNELLGVLVAPGRIEADGGQLLVPLDAVDGQLPLGSRGVHGGGVVDHIKHQADSGGAGRQGQGPAADQKCFHGSSPPKQYTLASTNICLRRAGHAPAHCLGNTGARKPGFRPRLRAVGKVQKLFRQPAKIPLLLRRCSAQKSALRLPGSLARQGFRGI